MDWQNAAADFITASTSSPRVEYSSTGICQILDMKSINTAVGTEDRWFHLDVVGVIPVICLELVASAGKSPSNSGQNWTC